MNAAEFVKSKYLKAGDLQVGQQEPFRISDVTQEELGQERELKLCLHFAGMEQALPLNRTQVRRMIDLFGGSTDGWINQMIMLSVIPTVFKGEQKNTFAINPVGPSKPATNAPFGQREYADAEVPAEETPF